MLDVEMICPDLLFDTNLSTSENLNVEVANFLSKEAIYRANSVGELPTIGSKVILYVINNKDLYVWNTQTKEYDLLNFSQAHVGDGLITVFQNGAGVAAKVGDIFISNGTEWIYIPSGDEPSGTVTSVNLTPGGGISVSGGPITSSGSITVTNTGVRSISVNASTGTLSANTNGTSADLLAVENSNIDFSTYFG